jgi:protein SCO1/2
MASGSTEALLSFVRAVRGQPERRAELLPLLEESSPIYAGRGTGEAERLRGFIMASFADTGLPEEAMGFALEELETGRDAYAVAAAARAVRSAERVPAELERLLRRAADRIRGADDYVDFDDPAPPAGPRPATALGEVEATLAWLAAEAGRTAAPCCGGGAASAPAAAPLDPAVLTRLRSIRLEDQAGADVSIGELFGPRPGAIAFFYTRCMNPERCSLTVSKLARLQALARTAGAEDALAIAAISYDPAFDLPARLRDYGAARGLDFTPSCRLLRTRGAFEPLRALLDLGVGYGPATVNRHRVEMIAVFGRERAELRSRRLWDEAALLEALLGRKGEASPAS